MAGRLLLTRWCAMRVSFERVAANSTRIYAVLDSPDLSTPPYVLLSYQGLEEPTELWDALVRIGWMIPPRPKPPESAVSNGRAGRTVLPHRINDFALREGVWAADSRAKIGGLTVSILQRFGVEVHAPPSYERLLFPAQVDAAGHGVESAPGPADPAPNTLIIERLEESFAGSCAYRMHGASSRLFPVELTWGERARPVAPEEVPRQSLVVERAVFAWHVGDGPAPLPQSEREKSVRIAAPDARQAGELLQLLRDTRGDQVSSLPLTPMPGSPATIRDGLLIIAVVESSRSSRVAQMLLERFSGIIIRT